MSEKHDEIIKAVAVKHGITIGKDDPILVLQTINDMLMQEMICAQQANLDSFKSEVEASINSWSEDAKDKAERTLNAALKASNETMLKTMKKHTENTATAVHQGIDSVIAKQIKEARKVSLLNLTAAVLTVTAAITVLIAATQII